MRSLSPASSGARAVGDRPILVLSTAPMLDQGDKLRIDRKFHVGMLEYVKRLDRPLACLVPRMKASQADAAMDHVELSRADLPYAVDLLSSPALGRGDIACMQRAISRAGLVYIGGSERFNLTAARLARACGTPYVPVTEYTLRTELDIMRSMTSSPLRRAWREARLRLMHVPKLRMIRDAAEIHANGYPTYRELARFNPHRLLYFDTRALQADVVPETVVVERLAGLAERPPRLLFSGRYHPMKGALDVLNVGIALQRSGQVFRLDLYGTGPLKDALRARVAQSGTAHCISVHDAVPYKPDLIELTRSADLFLACHPQGDPSCTYLETFACGVPIAGYANEMWAPLCQDSRGGIASRVGDVQELARAVKDLLKDRARLLEASLRARAFAAEHTMEVAWDQRVARLNALASR